MRVGRRMIQRPSILYSPPKMMAHHRPQFGSAKRERKERGSNDSTSRKTRNAAVTSPRRVVYRDKGHLTLVNLRISKSVAARYLPSEEPHDLKYLPLS